MMLSRYATVDIQLARTGTFDLIIGRPTTLPTTGLLARLERFPFDKTHPQVRPPFG
jgi:hypothetical protein